METPSPDSAKVATKTESISDPAKTAKNSIKFSKAFPKCDVPTHVEYGAKFGFDISYRSPHSRARLGTIHTPHGTITTPNFIFCGTKAAMKAVAPRDLSEAGTQIILANTYHLLVQPGPEMLSRRGGLHKFMGWDKPMLTDSGGFQVFSMAFGGVADEVKGKSSHKRDPSLLKLSEDGATFRSYLDGSSIRITPESCIDAQRQFGADIIMPLDECTAFHHSKEYTARSMERSHRWEDRSLAEFARTNTGAQALYGIVQGGVHSDLRRLSAEYTKDRPFFGTAVGGCIGDSKDSVQEILSNTMGHVHPDRPVHYLGVGGISDIFGGVRQGIDTFDCVSPTRLARHGWALVKGRKDERINLRNAMYREDDLPIDPSCTCHTCQNFSRSYINYLFRAKELLAYQLLSIHNIRTMMRLMEDIRGGIATETLDKVQSEWLAE